MGRKRGYTPAVRYLRYLLQHDGESQEDSHYIDLAKDLSAINRRLYRQGKVYRIAGITVHSTSDAFVKVCAAPDSWVVRNAWKRGYKRWKAMNKLAERTLGRYHDFKVRLIDDMRTDPDKPYPVDSGNNLLEFGDWDYSKFQTPDGTTTTEQFTTHLLGPHVGSAGAWTSIGLVLSYGEARGTVNEQVPVFDSEGDDDPLLNLFDDGTQVDEIAQNIDDDNDKPPYSYGSGTTDRGESYPGSTSNHPKPIVHGETSVTEQTSIGYVAGFNAICGLLEIETFSSQAAQPDIIEVLIELAPGDYKGVAAYDI